MCAAHLELHLILQKSALDSTRVPNFRSRCVITHMPVLFSEK